MYYVYTKIGFAHANGIKNQPVPIINPNNIQDDLIGKFFISPLLYSTRQHLYDLSVLEDLLLLV